MGELDDRPFWQQWAVPGVVSAVAVVGTVVLNGLDAATFALVFVVSLVAMSAGFFEGVWSGRRLERRWQAMTLAAHTPAADPDTTPDEREGRDGRG